jgi:hypothetical protein
VLDAAGNPVPGQVVVISVSGSGNSVFQAGRATDAAGQAVGGFRTTVLENKTVSATAGEVSVTQTQNVTAGTVTAPQLVLRKEVRLDARRATSQAPHSRSQGALR